MRGSALKLTGIFWARRFGQTVRNTNEHLRLSIWPEGPRDEILPLTARGPRRHAQQRGLTWQTAARTEAGRGRWAGGGGCCCQHLWVRRGLPVPLLLPLHPPDQAGSHPKLGSLLFKGQPCYRCELALGETPLHREIHGGHTPLILWGALGNRCWQVQHLPTLRQQNSPTPRQTSCTPLGKFLFMWLLCELLKASHSGRRKTPRKKKKKPNTLRHQSFLKWSFCFLWICHYCSMFYFQVCRGTGQQISWSCWGAQWRGQEKCSKWDGLASGQGSAAYPEGAGSPDAVAVVYVQELKHRELSGQNRAYSVNKDHSTHIWSHWNDFSNPLPLMQEVWSQLTMMHCYVLLPGSMQLLHDTMQDCALLK